MTPLPASSQHHTHAQAAPPPNACNTSILVYFPCVLSDVGVIMGRKHSLMRFWVVQSRSVNKSVSLHRKS